MVERRNVHRVLVGKLEGKRPLGRPRHRWRDESSESGLWGMDWIELAQDRDRWRENMNVVMSLCVPKNSGNFLTG